MMLQKVPTIHSIPGFRSFFVDTIFSDFLAVGVGDLVGEKVNVTLCSKDPESSSLYIVTKS